jgi:hypothetical protein
MKKIKSLTLPADPVGEEEVTFDKEGNIERFPLVRKLFLSLVIILVAGISFGLGRLSGGGDRDGIKLEFDPTISNSQFPITNGVQPASALQGAKSATSNVIKAGEVVASSKGKKYHYPHCPGAKQISEANKIVFASAQAAEASGYSLAANCVPR